MLTDHEISQIQSLSPNIRQAVLRILRSAKSDPLRRSFLKWLINYTNYGSNAGPKKYKLPKPEIIEYAAQFSLGSYTLYRGMGWSGTNITKAVNTIFNGTPPVKKQPVVLKLTGMSSWTLDLNTAYNFARGKAMVILETQVKRKDVVLDTVNMAKKDKELGDEIMFPNEKEVILKPGIIKATVVESDPKKPSQWNHLMKTVELDD